MNGKALQDTAQKRAEELPATTLYSFEPGWEAVRVVDKWFMLVTEAPGRPVVILKSRLPPGDSIDKKLVKELVTESYRLVVANLPKSRQPVDPARFGTG